MVTKEEELRREYTKLSALQERLKNLLTQQRLVETQQKEIRSTSELLKDLSKLKAEKQESFIHIGAGIYLNVNISPPKRLLVDVGAKSLVERNLEGALDYLKEKEERLKELGQTLMKEIEELATLIRESEAKVARLAREIESKGAVAG